MATSDYTSKIIEIPLEKDFIVLIDEIDIDLMNLSWRIEITHTGNKYVRQHKITNGKQHRIHLHRVILERILNRPLLESEKVDHINGNGLDNSRGNIRLATTLENSRNRKVNNLSVSKYKGVGYRKDNGLFRVRIQINGKRIHLGNYQSAEDAACIYNHYAIQYFGEFAWLNEIPNWEMKAKILIKGSG